MFRELTLSGIVALLVGRVCLGDLSSLWYDIDDASDGDYCVVEQCLDLGEEDKCWETPVTDSETYPFLLEICDELEFITCDFEDLIWKTESDNEPDCWECPGCPCDTEGEIEYHSREIGGLYKQCFGCVCTDFNETDEGIELAWDCNDAWDEYGYTIYWYEDQFDSFECPFSDSATCGTYGGYDIDLGELYLRTTGTLCNETCYCDYDGSTTCSGIDELVLDTESDLYKHFIDDCGYELLYCLDTPETWVFDAESVDDSSIYCSCPRCGCDIGDTYDYIPYTDPNSYFNFEYNGCATNCECYDSSWFGSSYIDCDDYYESVLDIECPTQLECIYWDIWTSTYYYSDGTQETITNVDQDIEGCTTTSQTYCANNIQTNFGWYNGDLYTGIGYNTGCQESFLCEIADINDNECISYDVSFTATVSNCDGGTSTGTFTEDVEFTDYMQCCQTSHCNNQTYTGSDDVFDTSTCAESEILGRLFSSLYSCQTSEEVTKEIGEIIYCDSDEWYETMTVCEYLDAYVGQLVGCYCRGMGAVYDEVDSSVQTSMSTFMDNYLEEIGVFLIAYECDLTYACDLEEETLVIVYTEYIVSFDLVLTNFNENTYIETDAIEYIADIIGINHGNVEITDAVLNSDSVSLSVIVTYESETEAQLFATDLNSGDSSTYDFGDGSSVSCDGGTCQVEAVTNEVPVEGSANLNKISFITMILTSFLPIILS